ncbi:hypothetical protein F511_12917 [Dorcoceras hygrometricum]|uniref:Dystroglycan-like n=1 Tax=Dorcoceras hygrometricum TaxID=472368 RepID=A0A2Z7BY95_9LAMI|nr:hypothetical protein F511_12917 [Dorcoceras hygrometricum]
MASPPISNNHHIDFDSVFDMDDAGLAQVFETLIATGLRNFLGWPAVFYEEALLEFFANGTVRNGLVVSTVRGVTVEISEQLFAETFELPVEGLTDLTDVPKDKIFDARSLFSASKEQVSVSCFKKEMKIEYRLLHDILAKTLFVKAGSFDAAKGFAIQIGVLLQNVQGLVLGESKGFPKSRILDAKIVHRFIHINEKIGLEESAASPRVKKTSVKKAVSKKRQVGAGEEAPVMKKKRTTKGKPVVIAQEAVPLQTVEATTIAPVEKLSVPKRQSQKRKRKLVLEDATVVQKSVDEMGRTWFDRAFDEMLRNDSPVVIPSDTDEEEETMDVGAAGGDQQVQSSVEGTTDDELLSIEEHQARIPFNASIPSTLAPTITPIRFGQGIEFREVDAYKASLSQIDASDKGKGILVEYDVQGHPAREIFSLICADIEFLIALREKVVEDVSIFVSSFSLQKLATLQSEDIFAKEGQVSHGQRQTRVFFPFSGGDSSLLNIENCFSTIQDIDSRPYISRAFSIVWAEICMEVVQFSLLDSLRTVGSVNFCRDLVVRGSVVEVIETLPKRFRRIIQQSMNCSSFVDSVVQLDSADIQLEDVQDFEVLSSDGSTVYRSPSLRQESSSSFSSDESMNFDDSTSISLPATASTTPDVTEALNQLRASIDEIHAQDRVLGALRRDSNDQRNLLSLELQSSHKQLGTQIVTTGLDVVDVRRVVRESHQELNARINSLDEQVAATRNDLLKFSAQAQQTLNIITSQLSELVAYINRGGDNKKGKVAAALYHHLLIKSETVAMQVVEHQTLNRE